MSRGRGFRHGSLARGGRRFRRWIWRLLAILVVSAAVVVGIGRLLAPYADHARPALERYLSARLEQPVRIERVEAEWPRLSPRVDLRGLSIGAPGAPDLEVGRARLDTNLLNLLRPARNTLQLVVLDLDLALSEDEQGRWQWHLERGGRLAGNWQGNLDAGDVLVRNARIRVDSRDLGTLIWTVTEAGLHRDADRISARVHAHPAGSPERPAEFRVRARLGDSGLQSLNAWLDAPDLTAPEIAPRLADSGGVADWRAGMEAWLDWHAGRGLRGQARLELLALGDGNGPRQRSGRFDVRGRWMPGDWAVQIDGPIGAADGPASPVIRRLAIGSRDGRTAAVADALDLDFAHILLAPWLPEVAARLADLSGRATGLAVGVDADGSLYLLSGQGHGIGFSLPGPGLRVAGLHVSAGLDGDEAVLDLFGAPAVDWPDMLRVPVQLDSLAGRLGWRPGLWRLDRIRIGHPVVDAEVDGWIQRGSDGRFLDFRVVAPRVEPDDPRPWLPHGIIPDRVEDWLDRALTGTDAASGDLVFHGRPRSWPELLHPGAFSADVAFTGLTLDYWQDWPPARDVDGRIRFAGRGFSARVDDSRVAGTVVRGDAIELADYGERRLILELSTPRADAAGLAGLAAAFPVGGLSNVLETMGFSGPAGSRARVELPMRSMADWALAGRVDFDGMSLVHAASGYRVDDLRGAVAFDREGFRGRNLSGALDPELPAMPVDLSLEASFRPAFRLEAAGDVPVAALVRPLAGAWPVSGASRWELVIDRGGEMPGVRLTSDLAGTGIGLPAPLDKPPAETWPLDIFLPLGESGAPARFSLADRLAGRWSEDGGDWQLELRLGPGEPPLPGPGRRLAVAGRLPELDVGAWLKQAPAAGGALPGLPAASLDLAVERIVLGGRDWPALALRGASGADGGWWLDFEGAALAGRVARESADGGVTADLQRLHWPAAPETQADPQPVIAREPSRADPRNLPALALNIGDMQYGGLALGRVQATARPVQDGLAIESLSADGPGISVTGSGNWTMAADGPRTRSRIRLEADNLARSLRDAGFDVALEGGSADIGVEGTWPGAPTDFSLEAVNGVLDVRISDGVIPEARPGAGRLLGLVSLNSIPRRLRLDFRDVFGSGLSFDSMRGQFRLSGGLAETDGLEIDAPAAGIRIRGTTDLVARRYDQQIRVQPGLGSTLPIIGALTGGPVGAAAGVALQQLLDRPLRGLSEVHYRITGSWDDPLVELVGAEPAEPSEPSGDPDDG